MSTVSYKGLVKIEKQIYETSWDRIKYHVMEQVVLSRLSQINKCKSLLLSSKPFKIVNADRYDKYFGSGIDAKSMRWIKSGELHGKNVLGEIYMKERSLM